MKKQFIVPFLFLVFSFNGFSQQTSTLNEIKKLNQVLNSILTQYVDSVQANKLVEDAIVGMLEKLDPHSTYIPKEEVKKMNEPLEGSFEGIGIQFQILEDTLFVVQTIAGGPSEKVGILAGDRIVYVNDSLIASVKLRDSDVLRLLRGKKGTEVNVRILRRGVNGFIDFKIIRDKIPIYSLDAAYMITDDIGYIKLNRFAATTLDEFQEALKKLKKKGLKSLILDLQGNGGGYLHAASALADEFLSENKIIVYTQGLHQLRSNSYATRKGNFENGRLIVLVDESSASASEIVSGAVQDWDRGMIVGRRTFGKGLVQKPLNLLDGSMIRLTISRYYTPAGRSIQKPYSEGKYAMKSEKLSKEFIERYNERKLIHEDSLLFPDSLRKSTKILKRTVYGGGGIMPDYYVPMDTAAYSSYFRKVVAKGILNKIALQYVDKEKKNLLKLYPTFDKFKSHFQVQSELEQEVIAEAEREKIPFVADEYERSKPFMMIYLKAIIARDIWTVTEYFQVINEQNEIYNKAVDILRAKTMYDELLK